jgi:dTDP-4-amino-4,6-dideoxygalactose transaminase
MSERLAIHGGTPVRGTLLSYGRQAIDEDDVQDVVAALRSDWLTTGPQVARFERAVASAVGVPHAVAVSSGTAALHAAAFAAGIGPGDQVVVAALTFAASANAVLYQGGTPVFADVRRDTLCVDLADIEAKSTQETRAVVAVDFAGQPAALDEIGAFTRDRRLLLIEDAAHALGAEYRGRRLGSLADLTTFSFHPVKHVTTGEGGLVTTASDEMNARLRRFRNHGLESEFTRRHEQGEGQGHTQRVLTVGDTPVPSWSVSSPLRFLYTAPFGFSCRRPRRGFGSQGAAGFVHQYKAGSIISSI